MSTKRTDEEMPQIYLDKDDRDTFRRDFKPGAAKPYSAEPVSTDKDQKKSSSGNGFALFVLFVIALGGYGASYWLYQQSQQQFAVIEQSQQRISDLEQQLSATGAEMGESTVALKVKVTKLGERSEELWQQMDKLWASAWRRNQADIKKVEGSVSQVGKNLQQLKQDWSQIAALKGKLTSTESNISGLEGKLKSQVGETRQLKESLLMVQSNDMQFETQMAALSELLDKSEKQNTQLIQRIVKLEQAMKAQQQVAAKPATQSVNLVN